RTKYGDDFKNVSMASWNFGHILAVGDKKISKDGMWVEPNFPSMFSLNMTKGSISGLNDPSSILLSASVAEALFGKTDPINKIVKIDNKENHKVTGVYEDLPHNTTLYTTKILLSWAKYVTTESWLKEANTDWRNSVFQAFVQVNDHA